MLNNFDPMTALTYASLFLFGLVAVTLHECAHGYVAYLLGDSTAKDEGRLTLNPIRHIDPIGLVCMILFHFGWAKPVPVDSRNFQNRRTGIRLVSIAGPAANMAISVVCLIALKIAIMLNSEMGALFFYYGLSLNVGFAVFNLFPFPPLDGSKIIASFLPEKVEFFFYRYQGYLSIIFMILMMLNLFGPLIAKPVEFIISFLLGLVL